MKPHENKMVITALERIDLLLRKTVVHFEAARDIAHKAPRPSLAIDNLAYAIEEVLDRLKLLRDMSEGGICQHEFARGRALASDQDIPEAVRFKPCGCDSDRECPDCVGQAQDKLEKN